MGPSTVSLWQMIITNSSRKPINADTNSTVTPRPKSSSCTLSHRYSTSNPLSVGCEGSIFFIFGLSVRLLGGW
jgi:hypothetical protein